MLQKKCKYSKKKKKKVRKSPRATSFFTLTRFRCSTPYFWIQALTPYFEIQSRSPRSIYQRSLNTSCCEISYWFEKKKSNFYLQKNVEKLGRLIIFQLKRLVIVSSKHDTFKLIRIEFWEIFFFFLKYNSQSRSKTKTSEYHFWNTILSNRLKKESWIIYIWNVIFPN